MNLTPGHDKSILNVPLIDHMTTSDVVAVARRSWVPAVRLGLGSDSWILAG